MSSEQIEDSTFAPGLPGSPQLVAWLTPWDHRNNIQSAIYKPADACTQHSLFVSCRFAEPSRPCESQTGCTAMTDSINTSMND